MPPARLGYLVAAGLAGSLAMWAGERLGFGHNYWAMVAAVVPLVGHTTRHRIRRGIQGSSEMSIIRQDLPAQVFVTPLALISTLLVVPSSPGILLRDRTIEAVVGAAVGIAVVLAPGAWRRFRERTTAG